MIATTRLRMRALAGRDLPLFRKLYADADTMRHIGRPLSEREVEPSFRATLSATCSPRGPWFFAIVEKRGSAGIGLCSIRNFSVRQRSIETGLMLIRTARGRGLAAEALTVLLDVAFRALPIDTVWVQYRRANTAVARLFDALDFADDDGWRPPGAKPRQCVRILRRPELHTPSDQSDRGYSMSNIIGFMEQVGRDAAMRHASREQLLCAMQQGEIELSAQSALLQPQRSALNALLDARDTMYLKNTAIAPPKKKAPAKKKPVKKAPAKKPAKKAPAKRKR